MPSEKIYTEEEANQMLANQEIKIRLDGVEDAINLMDDRMTQYFREDGRQSEQIMAKINEGSNERRRDEQTLKDEIYSTFVKKVDLRTYAFLVITAVTVTVSVITWIGARTSANAGTQNMDQMVKKVENLLNNKLKDSEK